jgi:hypothetical protein
VSFWARLTVLAGHKEVAVTGAAALAVVLTGSVYAATSPGSGSSASNNQSMGVSQAHSAATPSPSKPPPPPPKPLYMTAVKAGQDSNGTVDGTQPVTVTFNAPLSPSSKPALSPNIPGSWKISGDQATFTPETGWDPGTTVSVTTPQGTQGVSSTPQTKVMALKSQSKSFTTGGYSGLRLQELLAQLGYLPVNFAPSSSSGDISGSDAKAQLAAAYNAPQGSFSFNGSYPSQLTSLWKNGETNLIQTAAIQGFESQHGLSMDGQAGPEVWHALLTAAEQGQKNPNGYTYALATQGPGNNSNLVVYHNGKQLMATPANTGVAGAPTIDGTYPVYDRTPFQIMKGKNPDGSKYKDPVHWISYFNGGDAIHGFNRTSYGSYQSVGCVEVPVSTAKSLYPYLNYGTLVTVQGPAAPSKAPKK